MNPLQPHDAFGTTHVAALLLLGIDALAQDVRAMAADAAPDAFAEPDALDFALVGICALGAHINGFADPQPQPTPTSGATWLTASERALR